MVSPPDTPRPDEAPDARTATVKAAMATWTRSLVELGGPNTLLWHRDLPTGTLDLTTAHPGGVARLMTGRSTRLSDLYREHAAFDEARRRARAIAAKARELTEERGLQTCFAAFGMASWDLPGTTRTPVAPVLLRAATLRPAGPGADIIIDLSDEIEFNPVLEHYLNVERGLPVEVAVFEAMAVAGSGFEPHPTYAALAAACADIPGFTISPRVVVGTFTYAKLPMVADLAAQGATVAGHEVVAALAGDVDAAAALTASVTGPAAPGPSLAEAGGLVLPADTSQQAAINAALAGRHVVIEGASGTGKTQTIANLMAAYAGQGQRVLVVAEKRAALDALVARLDAVGLGFLTLDFPHGSRSRGAALAQLAAVVADGIPGMPPPVSQAGQAGPAPAPASRKGRGADGIPPTPEHYLRAAAATLADHRGAVHDRREPWGVSAHEVMSAIVREAAGDRPARSSVRLVGAPLAALTSATREATAAEFERLARLGAWRTDGGDDPWFGASLATEEEAEQARETLEWLLGPTGLSRLDDTFGEVFAGLRYPDVHTISGWGETLGTLAAVRDTLEVFRAEVFDAPLDEAVAATAPGQHRGSRASDVGWWERRRIVKEARRLLRPGPPPADFHGALRAAAGQRSAWRDLAGAGGRPEIPADLDRARTERAAVAEALDWFDAHLPVRPDAPRLVDLDRGDLERVLTELAAVPDQLAIVPRVRAALEALYTHGWRPLVNDLRDRAVPAEQVADEVRHVWWTSIADELFRVDPRLREHRGDDLRAVVNQLAEAERSLARSAATQVRDRLASRVTALVRSHSTAAGTLREEVTRSRGGLSVHELMPLAGELMTGLRPCWVMSPLVVAGVIPPGSWFDVVIIDEASQVAVAAAVPAITRARQVIVVGDPQQVPPTSFATAAPADESVPRASFEPGTSILDALRALVPPHRLDHHYRSLDERLIGFSNAAFYGGELATIPAPSAGDPALTLEIIEGHGVVDPESATIESTRAEVDAVVPLVLDHARHRPHESLAVLTLGMPHAARLEEALRHTVADLPEEVAAFFDPDAREPFVIKPVERAQGEHWDAVIFSVGYGKTAHGRVMHRFGPLNQKGGEFVLNVAGTRARRRLQVVSAMRAEDLAPERLKSRGGHVLRDFLAYAAGPPVDSDPDTSGTDDALVVDLARRLRDQGLIVHDIGADGSGVDLAVTDPARADGPWVAVLTDGLRYAALSSPLERDRLRVEELKRRGWQVVHVWGTDLYRDPARDVERIRAAASGPVAAVEDELVNTPAPVRHTDDGPTDATGDER